MTIKPTIAYEDFDRLDIRVGRVIDVERFARARTPSYKVTVDFGADIGTRRSSAQITRYDPAELVGRTVVCVLNFAPRNIAGFQSEVLIMGARNSADEVVVLTTESDVPAGRPAF